MTPRASRRATGGVEVADLQRVENGRHVDDGRRTGPALPAEQSREPVGLDRRGHRHDRQVLAEPAQLAEKAKARSDLTSRSWTSSSTIAPTPGRSGSAISRRTSTPG